MFKDINLEMLQSYVHEHICKFKLNPNVVFLGAENVILRLYTKQTPPYHDQNHRSYFGQI